MGSYIELNDTLQITSAQGFPNELDYEKHKKKPFTVAKFKDTVFEFRDKKDIRVYHAPPVRVFFAHNIDGKWLYWGRVEIIEVTNDYLNKTTSGKYRITHIFSPKEMINAQNILHTDRETAYFDDLHPKKENDRHFSRDGVLRFKYVNWEGKTGIRSVKPLSIWFGTTQWHPGKHWFLKALDIEKNSERDFDMESIVKIYPVKRVSTKNTSKTTDTNNGQVP